MSTRLMPSEMTSRRPCRRASYSASLLDTSKWIGKHTWVAHLLERWRVRLLLLRPVLKIRRSTWSSDLKRMVQRVLDFLFTQPGSQPGLETWLLFLAWILARVLLVRLPILRCDQSHLGCVRYHPLGSPWWLISCTRRSNVATSLRWSVLHREVSELVGIILLIQRVLHKVD